MLAHVWSSTVLGVDALPIEVEVATRAGQPKYLLVGLPDSAVRESHERCFSALRNSNLPRPRGIVTVNLAPVDVRKEGAAFDLPIAVGLMATNDDRLTPEALDSSVLVG